MSMHSQFPMFMWLYRLLTGHKARLCYFAVFLLLLLTTITARLRTYVATWKIRTVVHQLQQVRVDQTSEQDLRRLVPSISLTNQRDSTSYYFVEITNGYEDFFRHTQFLSGHDWQTQREIDRYMGELAELFGYRYMNFDAEVTVKDNVVSKIRFGVSREWIRPRSAGYFVHFESIHGVWADPRSRPIESTSAVDESPQYRPQGNERAMGALFTSDAPPDLIAHIFDWNLSCFWSVHGCTDAREIVADVFTDSKKIDAAARDRIHRGECGDRVLQNRLKYFPDLMIVVGKVNGTQSKLVQEHKSTPFVVTYVSRMGAKLKHDVPIASKYDLFISQSELANLKADQQYIYSPNVLFESCSLLPATADLIEIIRKSPSVQKDDDDESMCCAL